MRGLGQIYCSTPMCTNGAASIEGMHALYQSLLPNLQPRFQSAHDTIWSTYQANYSWWDQWIPFNPSCCSLQDLGQQADSLTSQMQMLSGGVSGGQGPSSKPVPPLLPNLLGVLGEPGSLLLIGIGLFLVSGALRGRG